MFVSEFPNDNELLRLRWAAPRHSDRDVLTDPNTDVVSNNTPVQVVMSVNLEETDNDILKCQIQISAMTIFTFKMVNLT